jgi:hypothetical protein
MTREILFRGKRVDNGKWVYGFYFRIWNRTYILWGTTNGTPNMYEVYPETVGQYTGLYDKNGNKIFEGDYGWYDEIKWTVVWVEEKGSFGFRLEDFDGLDEINLFWEFSSLNEWFEVIGNVHEEVTSDVG